MAHAFQVARRRALPKPVSIGRRVFQLALGRRVHEVYSFGVGIIVLCAFAIAVRFVRHAMTNLTLSLASARAVVVGVRGSVCIVAKDPP